MVTRLQMSHAVLSELKGCDNTISFLLQIPNKKKYLLQELELEVQLGCRSCAEHAGACVSMYSVRSTAKEERGTEE